MVYISCRKNVENHVPVINPGENSNTSAHCMSVLKSLRKTQHCLALGGMMLYSRRKEAELDQSLIASRVPQQPAQANCLCTPF